MSNKYIFSEGKLVGPVTDVAARQTWSRHDIQGNHNWKQGQELVENVHFSLMCICPACGGDGKETCNNPDHGFIEAMPGDIGRLGCPVCGHDPNHKVNRGKNKCPECNGNGLITPDTFDRVAEEYEYDSEPEVVVIPLSNEPKNQVATERFKKPTDQQIVNAAILFNDGKIEMEKLSDMVALCQWAVDRLYESGDISIPSLKENNNG